MVGSRVVFGYKILDDLTKNNKLTAESKIVDLHVMRKETPEGICTVNPKELVDAIKNVLDQDGDKYKIYNLSLNFDCPSDAEGAKDFLTRELDALAYQYKVLFVVSAGNQRNFLTSSYPECLDDPYSKIATPADGINVLSVGSLADTESSKSLAKNNDPSPFTRTGFHNTKKPDVVHY
jgi:hypothetical protein